MSVSPVPFSPFWTTLKNKHILVVGAGKTGLSVIKFLLSKSARISIWDTKEDFSLPLNDIDSDSSTLDPIQQFRGSTPDLDWAEVDGVVISPGVSPYHPVIQDALSLGLPVIGDIELFALSLNYLQEQRRREPKEAKTKLIGVTGSNGKTTVTLLIEHIIKATGASVAAVGNVGTPALEMLLNAEKDEFPDFIVLELSSFQLEMTSSLKLDVACYLNLSEDHLDRHGSLERYGQAKQRIYLNSKKAVFWAGQKATYPLNGNGLHKTTFSVDCDADLRADWQFSDNMIINPSVGKQFDLQDLRLVGLHNVLNAQAAIAAVSEFSLRDGDIQRALASFMPPEHRCVCIWEKRKVRWIDDSKATNPGATLAALNGIGPLVKGRLFLIAGGDAKGARLDVLSASIRQYVDKVFAFGKDVKHFASMLACERTQFIQVADLRQAVYFVAEEVSPDDVVLLSPACASIDMFDNYIHRAQVFAQAVQEVAA